MSDEIFESDPVRAGIGMALLREPLLVLPGVVTTLFAPIVQTEPAAVCGGTLIATVHFAGADVKIQVPWGTSLKVGQPVRVTFEAVS